MKHDEQRYLEISEYGKIHLSDAAVPVSTVVMRFTISNQLSDEQIKRLIHDVQPLANELRVMYSTPQPEADGERAELDIYERVALICEAFESEKEG
jgi:hypothetical protein